MDGETRIVTTRAELEALFVELRKRGYLVMGPMVREQAIVHGEPGGIDGLAAGWTEEQDGGHYRIRRRDDGAFWAMRLDLTPLSGFCMFPEKPLALHPERRSYPLRARGSASLLN